MRLMRRALFALLAVTSAAIHVTGIIEGEVDENNDYPAVGAIIYDNGSGKRYVDCTGTVVAPNKVLTAAHCVAFDLNPENIDPETGELGSLLGLISFSLSNKPFGIPNKCTGCIEITEITLSPVWRNDKALKIADPGDLAILTLKKKVHVTPMSFGSLSNLESPAQLRNNGDYREDFTVVGYGGSRVEDGKPNEIEFLDQRRVSTQHAFQKLNEVFLVTSQNQAKGDDGTCFADSGAAILRGPNKKIVAVVSKGDGACASMSKNYRTDIEESQKFLDCAIHSIGCDQLS